MDAKTTSTQSSVLIIYTGGTIGMIENPYNGALEAFDFKYIEEHVPEIKRFNFKINTISFNPVKDSSDMGPDSWVKIVEIIRDNYDAYDGFVILHGTDTMAFTASGLSFMLENLSKPVVLTGSQLPIGQLRTDGKENLITAIEIAAARDAEGRPYVNEVCVLFDSLLLRGNRCTKISADQFSAFSSPNYPPLASVGINIHYNRKVRIAPPTEGKALKVQTSYDSNVVIFKIFPGMSEAVVTSILNTEGLKGVVMETFGSGNAPCSPWFLNALKDATDRGIVVVNVTQCMVGNVEMKRYETGIKLVDAGVLSGYDSTPESAVAKLMMLLGSGRSLDEVKRLMETCLRGEFTADYNQDDCCGAVCLFD
ncbi:asparaginase [Porphyromonas sp.]|uniref:asparaginase n=1 Tax=Porphyromonas sp. TaxID=1924944 RepID=UPI0026DC96E0|nr:type I asparaginase [Porphyromonas sp.]MDO4771137.1 type I asparaginase [Porphyromonas sp.]